MPCPDCQKLADRLEEAEHKVNVAKMLEAAQQVDIELRKKAQREVERMTAALTTIAKWFGEFPSVKQSDGSETTWGVEYGSNGERDFMRNIARAALQGGDRE